MILWRLNTTIRGNILSIGTYYKIMVMIMES